MASYMWYQDAVHGWMLGKVDSGNAKTGFNLTSAEGNPNAGEKLEGVPMSKCRDWDPSHMNNDCCDLSMCSQLSEAPLLDVLRRRFLRDKPLAYTYVSDIVVAINPYKYFDHLTTMATPLKRYELQKDPHVWAIADFAYRGMMGGEFTAPKSQSVVISGESGAGKTVSCNNVMKYLTVLSAEQTKRLEKKRGRRSSVADVCIEDKIMACNPFLEAFGNATTTRNDNSSRFGRYTKILYDKGRICGAKMEDYLLEKSRVVGQPTKNRNYHVFYYLIEGAHAELRKKLQISPDYTFYKYTQGIKGEDPVTPAGTPELQRKSDADGFREIVRCLNVAGVPAARGQTFLWRVLTAVLELGNIEFATVKSQTVGRDKDVVLVDEDGKKYPSETKDVPRAVKRVAELLGLEIEGKTGLVSLLLHQVIKNPGRNQDDIFSAHEAVREAKASVDALSKQLYHDVFKFIVAVVNNALSPARAPPANSKFIGVLDIFGFEIFKVNSFSQLLINYANEMLQSLFNEHIFKNEVNLYKEEKLQIEAVEFKDNAPCCRLIDAKYSKHKFHGILSTLDDATLKPKPPTDEEWGASLKATFFTKAKKQAVKSSAYLQLSKPIGSKRKSLEQNKKKNFDGKVFWIDHYAGAVGYSTQDFLAKNLDKVPDQFVEMMRRSSMAECVALIGLANGAQDPNDLFKLLGVRSRDISDLGPPGAGGKKTKKKKRGGGKKSKSTIGSKFVAALSRLSNTIRKTQPHYVRCVQPNNFKLAANTGKPWQSFDGVKVQAQLVRAGLMETIAIRKRGYPFRQAYKSLWDQFQNGGTIRLLTEDKQRALSAMKDEQEKVCGLLTYALGEEGEKLWSKGSTMLFGKDSLLRTVDEWKQRQCADIIQRWTRHNVIARSKIKYMDRVVFGVQRLWMKVLIRRRSKKCVQECAFASLSAYNGAMSAIKNALQAIDVALKKREEERRKEQERLAKEKAEREKRERAMSDEQKRAAAAKKAKRKQEEEEESKKKTIAPPTKSIPLPPEQGGMKRQLSRREKLLQNMAKNRQKSKERGLSAIPGPPPDERKRKMSGKDALKRAFKANENDDTSGNRGVAVVDEHDLLRQMTGLTGNSKAIKRRFRRVEMCFRLFGQVEEEYLEKKDAGRDVFDKIGDARFNCYKKDKFGLNQRRVVVLNKKQGTLRTMKPGNKESKQLSVQRIVSVRREGKSTVKIVFGSFENTKKNTKAHRPYSLCFDHPNEMNRFVNALEVVQNTAPKRGKSICAMERLGSFVDLDGSSSALFGTASSLNLSQNLGPASSTAVVDDALEERDGYQMIRTKFKGTHSIKSSFSVIKTNVRGARQERILKFIRADSDAAREVEVENGGPPEMWDLASKYFSQEPYSNGSDAKYEAVKKRLRERWGEKVINSLNKKRLKGMARLHGKEPPCGNESSLAGNSRDATYYIVVATLDGDVRKVIDADRVADMVKSRQDDVSLKLIFGAPFYFSYLEAFKHWERVKQLPYNLEFDKDEDREEFMTSMLWVQQYSREIHQARKAQDVKKSMLGGGSGRCWQVSYRSTSRWWPHTLVWRLEVEGKPKSAAIAIFRSDLPATTPLRERVVVRFAPHKLRSINMLSRILWPDKTVTPLDSCGFQLSIESSKGTRRIGVIFGDELSARNFLNFAVEQSSKKFALVLSDAVANFRTPDANEITVGSQSFVGGQQVVKERKGDAPPSFQDCPPASKEKTGNLRVKSAKFTGDGGLSM